MIPHGDTKHNVCVGDFFRVYDFASFTFDTICSVATCLGSGALIDLVKTGQNNVKLVIQAAITVPTVVVFA
jgi:hypothetical protein